MRYVVDRAIMPFMRFSVHACITHASVWTPHVQYMQEHSSTRQVQSFRTFTVKGVAPRPCVAAAQLWLRCWNPSTRQSELTERRALQRTGRRMFSMPHTRFSHSPKWRRRQSREDAAPGTACGKGTPAAPRLPQLPRPPPCRSHLVPSHAAGGLAARQHAAVCCGRRVVARTQHGR